MQMAGLYHDGNDSDVDVDQEKPVWDDDVDIDDIIPPSQPPESSSSSKKKKKKKNKDEDKDNEGGVDIDAMDADVVPQYGGEEDWDGTEEMRKRKLDEYMDEVYGLEFNDMVGFIVSPLWKSAFTRVIAGRRNAYAFQIYYSCTADICAHPCRDPHGHR
jgi:protein KRI1